MLIYRAHCRGEMYLEAQLPHMQDQAFWSNPTAAFVDGGCVYASMSEYRKKGLPLQTCAFRAIPRKLPEAENADANLVANIAGRSRALLSLAPVIHKAMFGSDPPAW